ncbi:MAG: hypothetical protein FWC26_10175 [Fibromonadales bacterium]|nr:hypothetical protein [Fibromonadales bacterium]
MNIHKFISKNISILSILLIGGIGVQTIFAQTAWDGITADSLWYTSAKEADAYTISTAEELAGLAAVVNRGETFSGKTVMLGADIDLGGKNWTPIGNTNTRTFQGIFDGQDKFIFGLYVSGVQYAGLFGYVANGDIKNVGVSGDVFIPCSGYSGVLAGYASGITITNSYAIGEAYSTATNYQSCTPYSGGLVGYAINNSAISNSYAVINVYGSNYSGGLAGYFGGNITNSYASGNVSASAYMNGYSGGLAGYFGGSITDSYANNDVSVYVSYGTGRSGGLAGSFSGNITNSYAIGNISASANTSYSGGLVGQANGITATGSYYNSETSGQSDNSGKGTPKTTAEMKTQSTYEGWDFTDTWAIDSSSDYPVLKYLLGVQQNILTNIQIYIANPIQLYTGSPITPAVDSVVSNGKKLIAETDYKVLYANNTKISTAGNPAKIRIQGIGQYYGSKSFKFYITDLINIAGWAITVAPIPDQFWTGNEVKPKPVVRTTIAGDTITLREGKTPMDSDADYWLSYTNNIDETASAIIHIDGIGPFTGTRDATFKIIGQDIAITGVVTVAIIDSMRYVYTGSPITPDVKVTYNPKSEVLVKDIDYTISYDTNTNAGMGTIAVTGIGSYKGTVSRNFPIYARNIILSMVAEVPAQKYTGLAITPSVTLTDETGTLTLGTDYAVTYASNTSVTQYAQIRISGQGNYTGQITTYFEIEACDDEDGCDASPVYIPLSSVNHATQIHNGINLRATSNTVVEVFNLKGNLISRQNFGGGVYVVSLGHLPKGLYIAQVKFGSEKQILRVAVR